MRLLEIIASEEELQWLNKHIEEDKIDGKWLVDCGNNEKIVKILAQDDVAKGLLNLLERKSSLKVIIYPIEGALPTKSKPEASEKEKIKLGKFISISKQELYSDIDDPVNLSTNFILMVVLSALVAGIGIIKDSVPVIIGAMVIAPFLGPNMSMAFGTTLGDWSIVRKSIITGVTATIIVLLITVGWGFIYRNSGAVAIDPSISYGDIVLALACGFTGVISIISGQGSTLVGVMVAAALLPPLARSGLLFGSGNYQHGVNSFLIFSTNIICLNIAGIITFYFAGIRPQKWWEKEKAKKRTRMAIIFWSIALVVLMGIIFSIKYIQKV